MTPQHRLIITEADHGRLLEHLGDHLDERMAFLFCGRTVSASGRTDWLVHSVDLPGDDEYRRQGPARVTLKSEFAAGRFVRARTCAGFVDVHSHPFSDRPAPSFIDERGATVELRVLADLAPDTALLRIITGRDGALFGEVHDGGAWRPLSEVVVMGRGRRMSLCPVNARRTRDNGRDETDTRTAAVVGDGVAALRRARVLVIGAGGVGSAALFQLGGLVDRIDIVDPDIVEPHNLPRLYGATEADIGQPKAVVLGAALVRRIGRLQVEVHNGRFLDARSEEMFRAADAVLCCPDHHAVRWAAAVLAARTMTPLVEVGCGGRRNPDGSLAVLGYHVRLQVPGGPCLACNGLDLSKLEDPATTAAKRAVGYIEGEEAVQGELVTLTTRAATDAVDALLRYLTGYAGDAPGHLFFDALRFTSLDLSVNYRPDPACSLCGEDDGGLRAAGDVLDRDQQILEPPREVADAAL